MSHGTRLERRATGAAFAVAILAGGAAADAQSSPLSDSYAIGAWTFRPSVELRVRAEYRRDPIDVGGSLYASTAILADGYKLSVPNTVTTSTPVQNQWLVTERARLGLAVDRGPVTGVVLLQDAYALGSGSAITPAPSEPTVPNFAPFEAYIDVHARSGRRMFLRVGRQRVVWGAGRLIGDNDWSPTARSLDAGRFGVQLGDVDVELLAALLSSPAQLPASDSGATGIGSGAQLYGFDGIWHAAPLLGVEVTGLSRFVRDPAPRSLKPSDTYVIDGRLFGDKRGFRYDLEGAYELGQVQSFGVNRHLSAFALAGRVSLETALPGHLTFGAQGAYATGDKGDTSLDGTQTRFDPILPDVHNNLGPMGLYAWSNLIEAGGDLAIHPSDDVTLHAGYRFVGLAEPGGRWSTATLTPVGASVENNSRALGSEADTSIDWTPVDGLRVSAGYGLFLFGAGAETILRDANRYGGSAQHWGFLQTTLRAP